MTFDTTSASFVEVIVRGLTLGLLKGSLQIDHNGTTLWKETMFPYNIITIDTLW